MRSILLLFVLLALVALLGASLPPGTPANVAAAPQPGAWPKTQNPALTCDFTPLSFNLSGTGSVGVSRPVSVTQGDTLAQFIAPPITATGASAAYAIVDNSFAGTVSGGVTGTFTIANLNGLLITNPEGPVSTPRGFQINELVVNAPGGAITAALAINFVAFTSVPPYYPRGFNGYLHSTATSGSYTPYGYNATVIGTILPSAGGGLTINAAVIGRLYSGGGSLNEFVAAVRSVPPNRAVSFQPSDGIAQFHIPDFSVGAAAPGHVTPRSILVGTIVGTINGGFIMDHNALVVDGGPNSGKGWLVGEFTFSNTSADLLTGPWLADLNNNSMSGYVFQVIGSGVYSDSLLFGSIAGALSGGGANFTGVIAGVYCEGSQIPTPTGTATVVATATAQTTHTHTPQATFTPTPTNTWAAIPTITATHTAIATATLIPCAITFTDVQPTDYFYEAVRYLYCRDIVSGYGDNTFRPYNNTTRAQLTKIVVLAEGWTILDPPNPTFTDVPRDHTFYTFIETALAHGIISGYGDGTFRPGNNVTRGQLCKIIVLAEQWSPLDPPTPQFTDVPRDHAFYTFVETAYDRQVVSGYGDGTFRPGNSATRGQICKIVHAALIQP